MGSFQTGIIKFIERFTICLQFRFYFPTKEHVILLFVHLFVYIYNKKTMPMEIWKS